MAKESDFDQSLEKELEKRVETISSPSYEFVPPINKQDGMYIVAFMIGCLVFLAYGVL